MKDFYLFDDTDDVTLESLAQDFPVLTDEEKERIYAMSERKYNNDTEKKTDDIFDNEEEVKGVERYRRPKMRTASIAAAAVLLIGAGSFGGYNIAQQLKDGKDGDNDNVTTTIAVDITQSGTEAPEDPLTEEYRDAAEELLAEYNDFLVPYNVDELPQRKSAALMPSDEEIASMTAEEFEAYVEEQHRISDEVEADANAHHDRIWFDLGIGDPYDHVNYVFIGNWNYSYFDTGMKFSSTDEVQEKALSFMSQSCIDKMFPKLIGEDLTGYEPDRIYRQDIEKCPDFGTYAMRDGKLYCTCSNDFIDDMFIAASYYFFNRKDEPVVITDITEDSFTACVKYESTSVPNKYDMTMKVVKNGENWIIDDIEPTGPELDAQKLEIVNKMMNSCDYYDKISAKKADFYALRDDNDPDKGKCTVQLESIYCDNRAPKEYSSGYYADDLISMDSPENMANSARKIYSPHHEKETETYCDGTRYYYWNNPLDLDGDESNGKEYSWYDWNDDVPHDGDAEKYSSFEDLMMTSYHHLIYNSSSFRPMICPNGRSMVINYLYDFSAWNITGETVFEGVDCYIIEFYMPSYMYEEGDEIYGISSFMAYVSKETGIPMATLYYGSDADVQSMEILYDVKFNGDAEPVPDVDMNAVGLEKFNYK